MFMGTRQDKLTVQENIKTLWSKGIVDKYRLGFALLNIAFQLQDMKCKPDLIKEFRRYAGFCIEMQPDAFRNAVINGELL